MADWHCYCWTGNLEDDVWHSKVKLFILLFVDCFSEMDQERFNTRLAIAPYLQAEEDIRYGFFSFDDLLVIARRKNCS